MQKAIDAIIAAYDAKAAAAYKEQDFDAACEACEDLDEIIAQIEAGDVSAEQVAKDMGLI